ncbi:hypothetical protein LQV05_000239 [Cryptococcus neoformans]|nr:hypothetical protein LQV05_000239 [Cryptococcus neoformans]
MDPIATSSSNTSTWMPNGLPEYNGAPPPPMNNSYIINGNSEWKLCIRDQKEARLIFPRFPQEFKYMTLDISDHPDQNLITIFPSCRDFVEEALSMGGTVLAHCNGGIALSPAIVVGYLMWKFNWTAEHALAHVQNKRYCVSTMSNQFKEYEPIYMAQKMVKTAAKRETTTSKRQVEEEDEEGDGYWRKQRYVQGEASDMMMD